jgi:hypothetical protein
MLASSAMALLPFGAIAASTSPGSAQAAGGGSTSAGSARVLFPDTCRRPRYRPTGIILTCGDGGFRLINLRWTEWTARVANGTGVARVNDCDPSCAEGEFRSYPVSVTLSQPRFCRNTRRRQFVRVTLGFPGERPEGEPARSSEHFGCGLGARRFE